MGAWRNLCGLPIFPYSLQIWLQEHLATTWSLTWNLLLSNCEHYFFFFLLLLKTCCQRSWRYTYMFFTYRDWIFQVLYLYVERSAVGFLVLWMEASFGYEFRWVQKVMAHFCLFVCRQEGLWEDLCWAQLHWLQRHPQEAVGDEEERWACHSLFTGSHKEERVWELIWKKKALNKPEWKRVKKKFKQHSYGNKRMLHSGTKITLCVYGK